MRTAKSWPAKPAAQQPATWVGEFQEWDGSWTRIAGPDTVRATIKAVATWRGAQGAAVPETRVRTL